MFSYNLYENIQNYTHMLTPRDNYQLPIDLNVYFLESGGPGGNSHRHVEKMQTPGSRSHGLLAVWG